jgi:hypothetical protein
VEIIGTVYVLMWPRYGSTVNSAHSNTILENSVFETYGLLSMVPYDTGGRVAITIWGINPSFEKSKILYRRVDVSPTDVSPTENSWMLRPLNIASLGYCAPDRCVPTLDRVKHETCYVGRYRGRGRPPAPNRSVGRPIKSEFGDGMVRSGAKQSRDTLSKGCNI